MGEVAKLADKKAEGRERSLRSYHNIVLYILRLVNCFFWHAYVSSYLRLLITQPLPGATAATVPTCSASKQLRYPETSAHQR